MSFHKDRAKFDSFYQRIRNWIIKLRREYLPITLVFTALLILALVQKITSDFGFDISNYVIYFQLSLIGIIVPYSIKYMGMNKRLRQIRMELYLNRGIRLSGIEKLNWSLILEANSIIKDSDAPLQIVDLELGNTTLFGYDLLKMEAMEYNAHLKKYHGKNYKSSGDTVIVSSGCEIKEYVDSDRYTFNNMQFSQIKATNLHLDNIAFRNCTFSGMKLLNCTFQGIRGIDKTTATNTITYDISTRENSIMNKEPFLELLKDDKCLISKD